MWIPQDWLRKCAASGREITDDAKPTPGDLRHIFECCPRHEWKESHLTKFASLCLNYNWAGYLQSKKNYHPKYWFRSEAFGDSDTTGKLPTQIVRLDKKLNLY